MQHLFTVMIEAETAEQAQRVVSERLGHDEDYGFAYRLDWQHKPPAPEGEASTWPASARAEALRDLAANADDEGEYHTLLAEAARLDAGNTHPEATSSSIHDLFAAVRNHPDFAGGTVFTRDDVAGALEIDEGQVTPEMLGEAADTIGRWLEGGSYGWHEALRDHVSRPADAVDPFVGNTYRDPASGEFFKVISRDPDEPGIYETFTAASAAEAAAAKTYDGSWVEHKALLAGNFEEQA